MSKTTKDIDKKLVFLVMVDSDPESLTQLAEVMKGLDPPSKYEFVFSNTKIESINRDELIKAIENKRG